MASIRAIYILTSDNKILFSRKFPTIENRLQKKMGEEYVQMNYPDRLVCNAFSNQVIKEELIQEEFKCKTYKEDLEIDHQKMEELIKNVDININVNNFKNYSECPIVTLNIQNSKIWPCLYVKKLKIYGVVFPNIDYEKYKSIKTKVEKELEKKSEVNTEDSKVIENLDNFNENDATIIDMNESNINMVGETNNLNVGENDKSYLLNENKDGNLNRINNTNMMNKNIYLDDSQLTAFKNREFEDGESNNNYNIDLNSSNILENNLFSNNNNKYIGHINNYQINKSNLNINPSNLADYFNNRQTDTDSDFNSNNKHDSKLTINNQIPNKNINNSKNQLKNIETIGDNNANLISTEDSNLNKPSNLIIEPSQIKNNQNNDLPNNLLNQKKPSESFNIKASTLISSSSNNNLNNNINNKKEKELPSIHAVKDSKENLNTSSKEEEKLFKLKKLYEEQDVSIVGCITLMENLLDYIIASKSYEENKIHTLISNMVPFGNIIETNINFMLESLNFLNQRLFNSNALFSHSEKKSHADQEKIKIPGWVTKIPTHYSENLNITIKEELRFVKHGKNNYYSIIQCDISCLAELSRNCEITLPIKESKTNYLGNLRIHPCAKLENQNILNDATRIIFIPPHDEFKMGVFEIENFDQEKLPIRAYFCLKESAQNEVKLYLKVIIDENVISKFEYFYINIPLGHFGIIIDTKIMVQVGEVSLMNNKTTLHWDLQNKVFDRVIVLSGTVNYMPRSKDTISKDEKKEKNSDKVIIEINKNYFLFNLKYFEKLNFSIRKTFLSVKMIMNILRARLRIKVKRVI